MIAFVAFFDESEQIGPRLRRVGVLSWSIIGILLVVAILFRFVLYPIRTVFPPLAIAMVVVYVLNPVVSRLAADRISRGWATVIVFVIFVGAVTAILVNLIPVLSHQVSGFLEHLPDYLDRGARAINRFAERRHLSFRIRTSNEEILNFVQSHRAFVFRFLGRVRALGESVLHAFITVLLALVLSFYILVDLPKIRAGMRSLIPAKRRAELLDLGEQIGKALGGFFRGQLLVALFVGTASAVGLTLIKLPFAVLVGLIAGIFNLVPLIGPFIGAVPAVFIGLLSGDANKAWQAALVLLLVQQLDNHVISPNVMGRTVKLNPITVMVALLTGGTIAGIGGMLLVVPGVAAGKILAQYAWQHRGRVIAQEPD